MTNPDTHWVRNECGTDRLPIEAVREAQRVPFYAVLDNIRSAHNVGSIFRTADGVSAAGLYLCGYTPTPPHRHLAKTALGAVDVVPWLQLPSAENAIAALRSQKMLVMALENCKGSIPLYEADVRFPVALVVGNEVDGLAPDTVSACDVCVHLPMHGLKNSLNVSVAFGIAVYELLRRYELARGANIGVE